MATTKAGTIPRSTPAKKSAASPADAPRRRGRPPKAEQVIAGTTPLLAREQVIERAVQMAKVEPLAELSIIGLAREFGVTPALIHYYIGSRDDLISGVVNLYFKTRVERLGGLTGDWRADVEHHARQSYALMVEYGGVLRYIMSHNRFRLFQQVAPGQTDYGLVYLNRMAQIFRDGGFSPEHSAMGYHLLAQYTMTAAYAEVSRQLPAAHAKFIVKRIEQAPEAEYGAAHFMAEPFARVDAESAFEAGLELLLDGMERWRASRPAKRARKATR
ncbi:TetR/AcrR family transcriptional regulator C-terminal domain-containing protein [Hydrogenophaga sp. 2FB]|uniref:TetR/AcrR family transcriptional regulator C-terminal domain-containing protein n=1 Tax=Hydrogenophaga sp. 2FB TaxID=2502187 RepID=UPI00207BBF1B|nr:TetR/AcrR family transcriptional regulator C-terminal domain-containing protein [Hydrogenophaga sp. 2FB]